MGSLVLAGASSGSTTITPTDAVTATLTLPSTTGTIMATGNIPAFSYYCSTATSLADNGYTKVLFQTSIFDTTGGMFASSRFTPTIAGYYQINTTIRIAVAQTTETLLTIYKNGSVYKYLLDMQMTSMSSFSGSDLIYLNGSTDYLEIYVFQSSGGAKNTAAISSQTTFSGVLARTA
jgi:hypothetical protein